MTTNWKNVNNWHWVEKNCIPWAKEYFKKTFVGLKEEANGCSVEITEIKKFNGDVDVDQRKGKVFAIYDVDCDFAIKGKVNDIDIKGKINIPEIAHDTEEDEYVFDITIENDNSEKRPIKDLIRKNLVPAIKSKLVNFQGDLIKANTGDVYIPPEKMTGHPTNTTTNIVLNKKPAEKKEPKQKEIVSLGSWNKSITVKDEFFTSAHELYDIFLNPDKVRAWTRSGASIIEPKENGKFEFWGNVSGYITKLVPDESISLKWRIKEFPENHYTDVTLNFVQESDRVVLNVKQSGLKIPYDEQVKSNWVNYYFNPIKTTFGVVLFI
jgi:activator of HSP90 ATPase